jgi:hypothetical protein
MDACGTCGGVGSLQHRPQGARAPRPERNAKDKVLNKVQGL